MLFEETIEPADEVKLAFNIGATADIPSGYWLKGIHGENLLLGGLGMMTAIAGPGNSYKSTFAHYMMLSAMARIFEFVATYAKTYDTEMNIHFNRLRQFASQFAMFRERDILRDGTWTVTDETRYMAEQFFTAMKKFADNKLEKIKQATFETPFIDTATKQRFMSLLVTFCQFDSWSEMVSSETQDMFDKNKVGEDSSTAMVYMRQGLAKTGFLTQLPHICGKSNHYAIMTAHVTDNKPIQQGPFTVPPKKPLPHIPHDKTIKGVGQKFFYLLHNCWWIHEAKRLVMDDKTARYPRRQGEAFKDDFDLNVIRVQNIRSKIAADGYTLHIVLSQELGIQPTLTEYYLLENFGQFGLVGNNTTKALEIMPEMKLQRTTVRQRIEESPRLVRAMNLTSEIAQMHQHQRYLSDRLMSPGQMKEKITAAGYDFDWLLDNTRGYWNYNNDMAGKYYLSSLDFIDMANGTYHPYWMEDDRKTVKKQYHREIKA